MLGKRRDGLAELLRWHRHQLQRMQDDGGALDREGWIEARVMHLPEERLLHERSDDATPIAVEDRRLHDDHVWDALAARAGIAMHIELGHRESERREFVGERAVSLREIIPCLCGALEPLRLRLLLLLATLDELREQSLDLRREVVSETACALDEVDVQRQVDRTLGNGHRESVAHHAHDMRILMAEQTVECKVPP